MVLACFSMLQQSKRPAFACIFLVYKFSCIIVLPKNHRSCNFKGWLVETFFETEEYKRNIKKHKAQCSHPLWYTDQKWKLKRGNLNLVTGPRVCGQELSTLSIYGAHLERLESSHGLQKEYPIAAVKGARGRGGKSRSRIPGRSREAEKPNSRAKPRSREAEFPGEAEKPNSRAKPRSRIPRRSGEAENGLLRHILHTCPNLLRYILYTCPNVWCNGTHFTHVQTCDVTRVQSATEWTASVHTSHMSNRVM